MRLDKLAQLRSTGRNPRWLIVSAVIHVVVIAVLVLVIRPFQPVRKVTYIDLGPPDQEAMPPYRGPGGGGASARPIGKPSPRAAPPRQVEVVPPSPGDVAAQPTNPDNGELDSLPMDTHRQLGPEFGDGRLWVRVGDAAGGKLPARVAVDSMPTHVARVDSALASKIRIYLDTVPPDSFATRAAPKWTTEIAGKTWGLDGKWIYLGGVKIPTALLALLPIPAGGNYDGQAREGKIEANRRDILESGERAANAVEFNRYVKELRQRKDIEHRAVEEPPPPPPPPPPLVVSDTTKRQPLIP